MRRVLILGLIPCALSAADWLSVKSGPFEVYTEAGSRSARETLITLEQFRFAFGNVIGEQNLDLPQPLRVLLFKDAKGWNSRGQVVQGRDRQAVVLQDKAPIPPEVYRVLGQTFLETNTTRIPEPYESALLDFFSTFTLDDRNHIVVGAPPAQPTLNWARIHFLIGSPELSSRTRILLANLRRGAPADVAFKNAYGKTAAEMETEVRKYYEAGRFEPVNLPNLAITQISIAERDVSDADARLARADLLSGAGSADEYEALLAKQTKLAESQEGLGLIALAANRKDEARGRFESAMEAGSSNPRCYIEYAKLEPDGAKAEKALLKALGINSKLAEPFALLAARDTDPAKRAAHWKAAADRSPRNLTYWQNAAEAYIASGNFSEAAKAWTSAEQAASDPEQHRKMQEQRVAVERQRLDYEEAEKRRAAEEEARETERLKAQARAEVHTLEAKANAGDPKVTGKVVPWWDGPQPSGKVTGSLTQVDCLGTQARLIVQIDNKKTVKLLVTDPSKVAINGPGEVSLGCGARKPRRVTIEYFPRSNAKLATAGEVATIEFK